MATNVNAPAPAAGSVSAAGATSTYNVANDYFVPPATTTPPTWKWPDPSFYNHTPEEWRMRHAFFQAIAGGDQAVFNNLLNGKRSQDYVNSRAQVSFCNVGGDTAHYNFLAGKLLQRIAAEKTPSGKPYLPIPCEMAPTLYELSPLMVAKLYGREDMAAKLIAKGAGKDDTTPIPYLVTGDEDEPYSAVWKAEKFAMPVRSAAGGTRRRRGAKKPVRRNRRTRRTPHKK